MRVFLWSLLGFAVGTVVGYAITLFGWIAYADLAAVVDRDGGKIMGVAFVFAPLGGVVLGLLAAFGLGARAAVRAEER